VSGAGDGGPGGPGAERTLLRRAVAAGTVLLRNEGGLLPLDPGGLRRVALIGPNAAHARIQGGGSAGVYPRDVVSPLDVLRAALAGVAEVSHAAGVSISDLPTPLEPGVARDPRSGEPGVLLRVLDSGGAEQVAERRLCGRLLEPAVTGSSAVIEISAVFRPDRDGDWRLSVGGWGPITLTVDGRTVLDEVVPRDTDDPATVNLYPPYRTATVRLAEGREVLLVARRRYEPDSGRVLSLAADPPPPDPVAGFDAAVRLAGECDVAVVVVGTSEEIESEGFDRAGLALPGRQDELVRAVAAANPRTVVIVNSGGPVALPWRDQVPAVLLSWFPGQEAGNGLADVLLGVREPGGRLPTTWSDSAIIAAAAVDGVLDYAEGPGIGYRAWAKRAGGPAYWFGHGLGYTTWAYEGVSAPERVAPGGAFTVRVRVRNTGARAGREVVQVYLARPGDDGPRLAGFAAAEAAAGEATEVEVEVGARAMRHWATEHHEWRVAPGVYTVLAGHDFGDLPLAASVRCGETG
jgi:beta-glucosidase